MSVLARLYIWWRNRSHRGYSACSRCGGNWGWKKFATHAVSDDSGLFLFCADCDKIVSPQERWDALDRWKREGLFFTAFQRPLPSSIDLAEEIKKIRGTEFLEWPRERVKV